MPLDETTMQLDRDLLHRRPDLADALLDGQHGTILHEVSHYTAANADGMVRGHLVIHASSARAAAGFVPDDMSAKQLASDPARRSFVASAGLLGEHHFCGQTRPARARADIAAHQAVFGLAAADLIIAGWKRDHLARIGALAGCIAANVDRCVHYCDTHKFLINDHHVIPSCMLRSPRRRGLRARLDEAVWTYPLKERRQALEEFLAAHAGSRMLLVQL